MRLPDRITKGNKYQPAMRITDLEDAAEYFEACVEHCMRWGHTREEAESIERSNLGYYAGYYDSETRARVERLFNCAHPVFGAIVKEGCPTPIQCLAAGMMLASETLPPARTESPC